MKSQICEIVTKVLKELYRDVEIPNFNVEPAEKKFGDYSTNVAMILAKKVGESPKVVAEKLVAEVSKNEIFEKVEIAGPGFINFILSISFLQQKISEILLLDEKYGNSDLGEDLKINVEFISANPTGPLTLGNGRGGYGGDCLSKVLESFGAKVEREYYVNDRGAQITALGHSILKDDEALYKGSYIDEIAPKVTTKDPKIAGQEAAAILMEEYIKKTIQKMGIKFDHWYSESNLFNGPVEEVLGMVDKKGLSYKKDNAQWLATTKFGDDKDRVLITAKGEYTYLAADLAYHYIKVKRGYNTLIDIWGADHHGYIGRMKAGVQILEEELEAGVNFQILITQLVRLISNGEEIRMSKRAGTYITLDELIDEAGPDVTRFFFLQRSLDTHMDFDLDLAKEHSEKNPVYYIQYAHARISSILAKHKAGGSHGEPNLELIKEPEELSLVKELIKLPDIVIETAEDYQIQRLPYYAISLADVFHRFYEKCKVISDDENLTESRIALILATKIVLKKTLDLMGISAPEKM